MTYTHKERGNAVWWVIGVIALIVAAYFIFRESPAVVNEGEVSGVNQEQITLEGEVVCLPHRDTSGPITLECAYGLRTENGAHYGLDPSGLPANMPAEYQVGDQIAVQGSLVPQSDMPPNFWETYNITGLVAMETYWEFTEK